MVKKRTTPSSEETDAIPRQPGSGSPVVEQLVTFQSEREFDVFSGRVAERLFLKLYVAARTSGLLAEISDRDWKTLCVLATYMNAEGFCHPSQAELARALGCSRQMANERVNHLAKFRFRGQPVLMIEKAERSDHGTWTKNHYQVLPVSQLSIFKGTGAGTADAAPQSDPIAASTATVSRNIDTVTARGEPVSSPTVTVPLDTNKNQEINQIFDPSKIRKGHIPLDADTSEQGEADPPSGGMEPLRTVLARHASVPPAPTSDDVRGVIVAYLQDFARELNDQAPLSSSVTRACNLYGRANVDLSSFIAAMYAARTRTQEHSGSIRARAAGRSTKAKMAFWFACLEEALGLRGEA